MSACLSLRFSNRHYSHARPCNHRGFSSWKVDRKTPGGDERQFEKCKLCLDLICSVKEKSQSQTLNSNTEDGNLKMKTSISPSSGLFISLLSLLVRTVCHWVALEEPFLINCSVSHGL